MLEVGVVCLPLAGVLFYATKRFFDDRAAARAKDADLAAFVRDRFAVHEKAITNAITQFASVIDSKNKTAAAFINRSGRRMPAP